MIQHTKCPACDGNEPCDICYGDGYTTQIEEDSLGKTIAYYLTIIIAVASAIFFII